MGERLSCAKREEKTCKKKLDTVVAAVISELDGIKSALKSFLCGHCVFHWLWQ